MKYCPNPQCPYARKFKRAGEYRSDATVCSDCGSALANEPPSPAPIAAGPAPKASDAAARLLVTFACGIAFVLLMQLPILGAPSSLFEPDDTAISSHLRMLQVGFGPFAAAFGLVELAALLVPRLRAARVAGPHARRNLDVAGWALGLFIFVSQLSGLIVLAKSTPTIALPPLWLYWMQLIAAHGLMFILAQSVSRRGLGNGLGLFSALWLLDLTLKRSAPLLSRLGDDLLPPWVGIAAVGLMTLTAVGAFGLMRDFRTREHAIPTRAPFPISGLVTPHDLLLALPFMLTSWLSFTFADLKLVDSRWYAHLSEFLALDASLIFGFLYFRPAAVAAIWARWNQGVDRTAITAKARMLLPSSLALAVVFAVGLPLLNNSLMNSIGVSLVPTMAIVTGAAALRDIMSDWGALRRGGFMRVVWELQRTAEIEPVLHFLSTHGITAHASGMHLRATQQFFMPWVPIKILVPSEQFAEAERLIATQMRHG